MPTYRIKFTVNDEIEADNEQEALERLMDNIIDSHCSDIDYYEIEEVKE